MALDGMHLLAVREVPDDDPAIGTSRGDLRALRRHRRPQEAAARPPQLADQLTRLRRTHANPVQAGADQRDAVGQEADAAYRLLVSCEFARLVARGHVP